MIPTKFTQLIGNKDIKNYLEKMLQKRAVANSLLFAGPDGIGKSQFAQVLAARLICGDDGLHEDKIQKGTHPDIHVYRPEGKLGLHSIQSLRQLCDEVHMPPYESSWKVFIIHDADRMLSYSANALLKTFEEPPPNTLIILLSHKPSAIIPTIISRCRVLQFQTLTEKEIEDYLTLRYQTDPNLAKNAAELAHGSIGRAVHIALQKSGSQRTTILDTLSQGRIGTYKELLAMAERIAEQVETARKNAEESAKEELYKVPTEYLTATQQQALEKELDGITSIAFVNEANALFEHILSWYRDLEAVRLGIPKNLVINRDYHTALEQAAQRGNTLPLDEVQKAIGEAQLSLQRSTSLQICLENLFLKLRMI